MQNDVIQYVERRLEEWADWYLRYNDFGLGYPKKSLEARLMETGGYLVKTTGPVYPPENVEAEEIEGLVAEIARQTPKLAQALRAQYFDRGTLPFKARKIGVSRTQFKVYVDMGKQWLAGRLSIRL